MGNEYVLQNVQAGYVGNDILFYRKNGHGYTCDLDDAHVFTLEDARKYAHMGHPKYKIWKKSDLNKIALRHVDSQFLKDIEEVPHEA